MSLIKVLILGIVHGITDILPVSGSGHLKIMERILNLPAITGDSFLLLNSILHFGTALAVIAVLHGQIFRMTLPFRKRSRSRRKNNSERRLAQLVMIGTIPAVIGVLLESYASEVANHLSWTAVTLMLNGLLLFCSMRFAYGTKGEKELTAADAILVGFAQLIGIIPGISRIATSVIALLWRDVKAEFAVMFAYLLSIPVSLGIALIDLIRAISANAIDFSVLPAYLLAGLLSGVMGYIALYVVTLVVQKNLFYKFAYYCWGAGLVALTLATFFV